MHVIKTLLRPWSYCFLDNLALHGLASFMSCAHYVLDLFYAKVRSRKPRTASDVKSLKDGFPSAIHSPIQKECLPVA